MAYQIVAAGSVDGVLTSASALRLFPGSALEFTQAFTVDKLNPEKWAVNDGVLFVDIAVNNQDEQMTIAFVQRIYAAGHKLIGICDEHDAASWQRVFEATGVDAGELIIKPCSQKEHGNFQSSGALFAATFSKKLDAHGWELCDAANQADHGFFKSNFAQLVNEAVKSDIANNARRVHLANHFSENRQADNQISAWVKEYETILATHEELIKNREVFGDIVRIDARGKKIDMTTLMFGLYKLAKVVVIVGESYNKEVGAKVVQHSFGTQDKSVDLLAAIKAAGVNAGGFAQKANVAPEEAHKALQAVIDLLAIK
jgi:hypothetical protein